MAVMDRLAAEREFHDQQASVRAQAFREHPEQLRFTNDSYLDHETWIRPAVAQLGDVNKLRLLDFGCGHAMAAMVFARLGAKVTAFDVSAGYLAEAAWRAKINQVGLELLQADGERLPFASATFDRVWGNAILHHLDIEQVAAEIKRILRPGGRAVFCEPWAGNRLLNWARDRLPYSGKDRTRDERPLCLAQVQILRRIFKRVETRGFQFLSMARRIVRQRRLVDGFDWCDDMLLSRVPALQNYCRYMVLTLEN